MGMTREPQDLIATPILDRLTVDGAIFLRAEYTGRWEWESLDGPTTAALLHPGSERVTLFHVVAAGRCWISLVDGERHSAEPGDVMVLPYGDQHWMGGTEPADRVPITTFMSAPPWDTFPVLSHGTPGAQTDIVCGFLHCEDPLFDPALRALPPLFVVRPDAAAAAWVRATIDYAMSASRQTSSIPALLLGEVVRIHLGSVPAVDRGWFAALRDPVLRPALAHLHSDPSSKWTVSELASRCAVSRSLLDARFRDVLGRSPIRYLTEWRMHAAEELLGTTDLTVLAVGRRVGYESEEAFSRAFKRARGVPPSVWRRRRTGGFESEALPDPA
jgi:AraC-like DNA-binding protein